MNIIIRNYLSGSYLLESEPNTWNAIIILDSSVTPTSFVSAHTVNHLYLMFDDIVSEIQGKKSPTLNHIHQAIAFAKDKENLMICCRAGQSRSAAIAFLISHNFDGHESAYQLLDPKRHAPNSLIINLGIGLIDDPTVIHTYRRWKESHRNTKLSDYYEEIEHEYDELELHGARNRITAEANNSQTSHF